MFNHREVQPIGTEQCEGCLWARLNDEGWPVCEHKQGPQYFYGTICINYDSKREGPDHDHGTDNKIK
jgi:hypothetical protein